MVTRYTDLTLQRTPNHRFVGYVSKLRGDEVARAEVVRVQDNKNIVVRQNVYINYFEILTINVRGFAFNSIILDATETTIKGYVTAHYADSSRDFLSADEISVTCIEFGAGQVDIQPDDVLVIYAHFSPHSYIPTVQNEEIIGDAQFLQSTTPSPYKYDYDINGAPPQVSIRRQHDTSNDSEQGEFNNVIVAQTKEDTERIYFAAHIDMRETFDNLTYFREGDKSYYPIAINPYTLYPEWRTITTVGLGTNVSIGQIGETDNRYQTAFDSKVLFVDGNFVNVYGGVLDTTNDNGYWGYALPAGVHHFIIHDNYNNNDSIDAKLTEDDNGFPREGHTYALLTVVIHNHNYKPAEGVVSVNGSIDTGWSSELELYDVGDVGYLKRDDAVIVWGYDSYGLYDTEPDNTTIINNDVVRTNPSLSRYDKPHVKFYGYVLQRSETMAAELNAITYDCVDVIEYLNLLQGFGNAFVSPTSDLANYGVNYQVANNSVIKQALLILSWYTNVLQHHPISIDTTAINVRQRETILQEGTLLDQVRYVLGATDTLISSTRFGAIRIHPDLRFVDYEARNSAYRTFTPNELTLDDIIDVSVNVLDYSPIAYVQYTGIIEDGVEVIRSTYPNNVTIGEGTRVITRDDIVVFSQDQLNRLTAIRGAYETNQVYDLANKTMLPALEVTVRLFGSMDIFDRFNEYFVFSSDVINEVITPSGIELSRYYFIIQDITTEFVDGTTNIELTLRSAPFMITSQGMTTAIETATVNTFDDTYSGYDAQIAILSNAALLDGLEVDTSSIEINPIIRNYDSINGAITRVGILAANQNGTEAALYTTTNFGDISANIQWTKRDLTFAFTGDIPYKAYRDPFHTDVLYVLTPTRIIQLTVDDYTNATYSTVVLHTSVGIDFYKNIAISTRTPNLVYVQRLADSSTVETGYLQFSSGTWSYTVINTYAYTGSIQHVAGISSGFVTGNPYFSINRQVYEGDHDNPNSTPILNSAFSNIGTGTNYNNLTFVPNTSAADSTAYIGVYDSLTGINKLWLRNTQNNISEDITLVGHTLPTYTSAVRATLGSADRIVAPFVRDADQRNALYLTINGGQTWKQITDYMPLNSNNFVAALRGDITGQYSNEVFAYGEYGTFKYSPNLGASFTDKAIGLRAQHGDISNLAVIGFTAND